MIAAGLVIAVVAALVLALGLVVAGTRDDPDRWAATNGVVLSDATRPVVARHLQTAMWLRRLGVVGGLVLPPAITAATGIDLGVSGLVWVLLGYLLGQVLAELWLVRVAFGSTRTVSLERRRLGDYLPRSLLLVQTGFPPALVVLGVLVVAVPEATGAAGGFEPVGGPDGPVVSGILAAGVLVLALVGERRVVRRPRPWADDDLVQIDDALRSWSVRVVGATGVALGAFVASIQLATLGSRAPRPLGALLWIGAAGVLVLALAGWVAWVQRRWSVERHRHARAAEVVA